MDEDETIISSGGFCAPMAPIYAIPRHPFRITYRVKPFWRRWWLRWHGWSTEWTCEYDPGDIKPVVQSLPSFTALRGGVDVGRS